MAFLLYPYSRTPSAQVILGATHASTAMQQRVKKAPRAYAALSVLFRSMKSIWTRLWNYAPISPTPGLEIRRARAALHQALTNMQSPRAYRVRYQIETSRTLRELWHLRAEVFEILAESLSEGEAVNRIEALNQHFPDRPRRADKESRASRVSAW